MAAQVLSGSGSVSYTNSTGQNVRLVINYLEFSSSPTNPKISFAGITISLPGTQAKVMYGKTLGYRSASNTHSSFFGFGAHSSTNISEVKPIPLEIALSNGDTFSITSGYQHDIQAYNIIIIPEAG